MLRRTDYHAQYVARVVKQGDDGSLDVIPDNAKIPGMTGVPIRYGVPGIFAKVEPGARVLVGFEGGNPAKPIATVWESASISELRITSEAKVVIQAPSVQIGDDGGAPIARVGDPVDVFLDAVSISVAATTGGLVQAVGVISAGADRASAS